jgi:hypothetical protein
MPETKEETPDEEVFTEKEEEHPWDAQPLTLDGTARMVTLLGGIMVDAAQHAAVQSLLDEDGQTRSGFASILSVLGKEQLAELLSIITGKSKRWVANNYSLVNASHAIGQFMLKEDWQTIVKNLRPTVAPMIGTGAVGNGGSPEPSTD